MDQSSYGERKLTPQEIEEVLSAIASFRISDRLYERDNKVFEDLKIVAREQLQGTKVLDHPDIVKELKEAAADVYMSSVMNPLDPIGSKAATTNSEPIVQHVLKGAQRVGIKENTGNVAELLTASNKPRSYEFVETALISDVPSVETILEKCDTYNEVGWPGVPNFNQASQYATAKLINDGVGISSLVVKHNDSTLLKAIEVKKDAEYLNSYITSRIANHNSEETIMGLQVDFSVLETLKLSLTPYQLLKIIKKLISHRNIDVEIINITGSIISCVFFSENLTGMRMYLSDNLLIEKTLTLHSPTSSYSISKTNVTDAITRWVDLNIDDFGIVYKQEKYKGWKAYKCYLDSPHIIIPANRIAILFVYLGIEIVSCGYNTVGRICGFTCVFKEDPSSYIQREIALAEEEYNELALSNEWDPENIFKKTNPEKYRLKAYSKYISIRLVGIAQAIYQLIYDDRIDWNYTFTNNVHVNNAIMGQLTTRQIYEKEWHGSGVTQVDLDILSIYATGTGPFVQKVNQSAIAAAGPLSSLNNNPKSVLSRAATSSALYNIHGSQAEIATGTESTVNGITAIKTCEFADDENEQAIKKHEKVKDPESRSTNFELPDFLKD
jgi:hypothetical protein